MFFCPYCGTLLLLRACGEQNRFSCTVCNYARFIPPNCDPRSVLTVTYSFKEFNKVCTEETEHSKGTGVYGASTGMSISNGKFPDTNTANTGKAAPTAEGGQVMTINCVNEDPPCSSRKAFYIQIQMRSADEPAMIFFKCTQCGHQWRQD